MATPIDAIEYYTVGEQLKAEDVNALIDWAKRNIGGVGFYDGNAKALQPSTQKRRILRLTNTTGQAIKPYSIFSIAQAGSSSSSASATPSKDAPRTNAAMFSIASAASPLLFVTNGAMEIPEGKPFEAAIVPANRPTRVRAVAGDIPDVGEGCGISWGSMRVGRQANGLVCLSTSWEENAEVYVWVCRGREPIKIVGCVTSKITKATKVAGKIQCGVGQVQLQVRGSLNLMTAANRPAFPSQRWSFPVYNYSGIEYPVGMQVTATDTLGTGLTVDFEQPNQFCYVSSSSSSRSSSSRSSSSSSSSSRSSVLSSSSKSSSPFSSSSRSAITNLFCCEDILGDFPGGLWPNTLVLTLSNACCPAMNQSVTLTKGVGLLPNYTAITSADAIADCNGNKLFFDNWLQTFFLCESTATNRFRIRFNWTGPTASGRLPPIRCVANNIIPTWGIACYMTLFSCNPLYLEFPNAGVQITSPETTFGTWCNGTVNLTVSL